MSSFAQEIRVLGALALPIVATQVGLMLMGLVDAIMVGHVSVSALAAAGLGHTWLFAVQLLGMGVVMGMDPLISQAHGRGDARGVGRTLQRGVVVGLIVSVPMGILWGLTEPVLLLAGQDPELARAAQRYNAVQIPCLPFLMLYTVMRQFLQGQGLVRPAMWVMLLANGFNVLFNWMLIFGNLGCPALGLVGAGIATALTRTVLFVALLLWIRAFRLHTVAWQPWSREAIAPAGLRQLLWLGIPVGLQMFLEVWAFSVAALMSGRLGEVPLASHTIVINMASLSFMVPLGISIGASTRVGNLLGSGQSSALGRACNAAFALGGAAMLVFALIFVAGRDLFPRAYTDDAQVLALAASVLPIAASFQLFDGLQVVAAGILRGMGLTRAPALANALAYYGLALPLGGWLAFSQGFGLAGIWWGLCVGLALVALMLMGWVRSRAASVQPV